MQKYFLIKQGDYLKPATNEDMNIISNLKDGDKVVFSTDDSRHLWRHRKYFALLNKVIYHMPEELSNRFNTPEKVLLEIKLQLGMYDVHVTLGEREIIVVKNSISFKSMGEKKFQKFVKESKDIILKWFLKDVNDETFEKEFMTLLFD